MSDRIDISNIRSRDLETQDFSNIKLVDDSDHANEILTSDKGGRLTLDREGRLKVICPPQRRDNAFVRFFKGLFSAAKREKYRELDRMDALAKNISFNQKAARELLPYLRGGVSGSEAFRELTLTYAGNYVDHVLQNSTAQSSELTLGTLNRNMGIGRQTVDSVIRLVEQSHIGLAFKSYCIENGGKLQAADEFARDILGSDVPDFKQIASGIATKALHDPESLKALLPNTAVHIDALHNNLLVSFNSSDDVDVIEEELTSSLSVITESFMQQLGAAAASGLQNGQEPEVLAGGIKSILTSVVQPDVSASELNEQLLGEQGLLAALQNGPAAGTGAPVTIPVDAERAEKIERIIQDAKTELNVDLTTEQSAKILNFCERNKVNLEKFLQLAQFSGEINNILRRTSNYQNFAAIAEQISSLRVRLEESKKKEASDQVDIQKKEASDQDDLQKIKTFDQDDFQTLGVVAAFYSDLIGEDVQGLANGIADFLKDVKFIVDSLDSKYSSLIEELTDGDVTKNHLTYEMAMGDLRTAFNLADTYTTVAHGLQTGARITNIISQTDKQQSKNYIRGAELWAQACLHHSEVTQLINNCIASSQLQEYQDEVSQAVRNGLSALISARAYTSAGADEGEIDEKVKDLLSFFGKKEKDLENKAEDIIEDIIGTIEQRQNAMAAKGKTLFGRVEDFSDEEKEFWKSELTNRINKIIDTNMQRSNNVDEFGVHKVLPGDVYRNQVLFYTDENDKKYELSSKTIEKELNSRGYQMDNREPIEVRDLILNTSIREFLNRIKPGDRGVAGAISTLAQQGGFSLELAKLYQLGAPAQSEMTIHYQLPTWTEITAGGTMSYAQNTQSVQIQRNGNELIIKGALNVHMTNERPKYVLKSFRLEIDTRIDLDAPRLENGMPEVTVTDIRRIELPGK